MSTNDNHTTAEPPRADRLETERDAEQVLGLAIVWTDERRRRAGEVALFQAEGAPRMLGRGGEGDDRVVFGRQRPGSFEPAPPLLGRAISRHQLKIRARRESIEVERVGRCPLRVNGVPADVTEVAPGDTLVLEEQLVLLCVQRPARIAPLRFFAGAERVPFGEADATGILGESPATWHLRERLAFAAAAAGHVLVRGESGSGKELAARAIHALSPRVGGPLVARNAATMPHALLDAELFGNVRNYPNAGMPERPGLVGEADRGTLVLDEIGELPAELHAHLLRVLDAGGEYHRLGEARAKKSDFRLVGLTNRPASALKHDLLARLTLEIVVPPLADRREDVPLLFRALLARAAKQSPSVAGRFVREGPDGLDARLSPELVDLLVRVPRYEANVRELDALLWQAIEASRGDVLSPPPELLRAAQPSADDARAPLDADRVRAALRDADGNVTAAARLLQLPSRYALYRLMRRLGIDEKAPPRA